MKRKKNKEKILIWIIFGFSLFLSFYHLGSLPAGFHNDEAEAGLEALRILRGESKWIGLSSFYNMPLTGFLHQCLTIFLLGPTIFGLRAASALVGSFSLIFFFFFVKKLFDQQTALLAVLLLAFSHYWIVFSHLGINYNLSVFLEIITFYFLVELIEKKRWLSGFCLGAACGFSLYLYFSSRIVPLVVIGVLTFSFLRRVRLSWKLALAIMIGFSIAALPMVLVYAKSPGGFNSRTNNVFVFSPEVKVWLEDVYKTDSKIGVLTGQIRKTISLSKENCDSSGQYGFCGRILSIPTLIFFILGMFLSVFGLGSWRNFLVVFSFWMIIIFGSVLTVPPLFMPRILVALPFVWILFARGFLDSRNFLFKMIGKSNNLWRGLVNFLWVTVVVWIILENLWIYFFRFPHEVWGDVNKYTATKIAREMNEQRDYKFIFLTEPYLYADFSTIVYLVPGVEKIGIRNPGNYSFDFRTRKVIYIFYPEYFRKLDQARLIYPWAELTEIKNSPFGPPSAYLLKVD